MVRKGIIGTCLALSISMLFGQSVDQRHYSHQDSLRGSITPERAWWDLLHYDLYVAVNPEISTISGKNTIKYKVLKEGQEMQIDLQAPLTITKAIQNQKILTIRHDGNAHFLKMAEEQVVGREYEVEIQYTGEPHPAINPPWEGGFVWGRDKNGKHFISTSCQGIGASTWWPCKEHTYDEPDNGMTISINCPSGLKAISNGRLIQTSKADRKTTTYTWEVISPINNYGVSLNIGDYKNFKKTYSGEKGGLDLDFWVLKDHLKKAMSHFEEAGKTLEALEYWFGPYPFYQDSYKLVEVPYLGMEHQSAVAYGNGYGEGYNGMDRSQTGWGLRWDYIIVHETAHEWYGNSITYMDPADMWIHESFASYAEGLYVEYYYGKEAGSAYLRALRPYIENRESVIGDYGVDNRGEDIYDKGANLLHMIREVVDDDSLWRETLRGMNRAFYHKVVSTDQIEDYISDHCGLDLSVVFDQYLRDIRIPVLEYMMVDDTLSYRWTNCIEGFNMPVFVMLGDEKIVLNPETSWARVLWPSEKGTFRIDDNFYVYSKKLQIDKAP